MVEGYELFRGIRAWLEKNKQRVVINLVFGSIQRSMLQKFPQQLAWRMGISNSQTFPYVHLGEFVGRQARKLALVICLACSVICQRQTFHIVPIANMHANINDQMFALTVLPL